MFIGTFGAWHGVDVFAQAIRRMVERDAAALRAGKVHFVLVGFPTAPGRTAKEAEAWLAQRELIVRGVGNYGLPNHLRITLGLEEHNRAVVDGLAEFMRR